MGSLNSDLSSMAVLSILVRYALLIKEKTRSKVHKGVQTILQSVGMVNFNGRTGLFLKVFG